MADSLHMMLSAFRNDILSSLAKLEFQVRDHASAGPIAPLTGPRAPVDMPQQTQDIQALQNSVRALHESIQHLSNVMVDRFGTIEKIVCATEATVSLLDSRITQLEKERTIPVLTPYEIPSQEILQETPKAESRNILTELEEAAKADAEEEEEGHWDADDEEETKADAETKGDAEQEGDVVEEEEAEEEQEVEEDEGEVVEEEEIVEEEEEEEEEEVEAQEEEEEEEGIEVEEFTWKGTVYQRDADNNVYLDGEEVGIWNGKKIVFQTA